MLNRLIGIRPGHLGAKLPEDKPYADKYPLSAAPATFKPVVLGINWYSDFDSPVLKDGEYYIGLNPQKLGYVRGGHAISVKPQFSSQGVSLKDRYPLHLYYDQGETGHCVGFAFSRACSWFNYYRFDGHYLYYEAKKIEGDPGGEDGTSLDCGARALARNHEQVAGVYPISQVQTPDPKWRIQSYRWAQSVDEVRAVLASPNHDKHEAVPLFNSWGKWYPPYVWLPYETLGRLLSENGDACVPTDA